MDDRVARRLLEDNLLDRLKRAEGNISLLQKLYTNGTGEGGGDGGGDVTVINNTTVGLGAVCFLSETASDIADYKTLSRSWADTASGTSVTSCTTGAGYELIEEFSLPAFDMPVFVNGNFNLDLYLSSSVDQIVYFNAQVYLRDALGTETLIVSRALSSALNASVSNLLFTAPAPSTNIFYKINTTDRFVVKIYASVATEAADITLYFGDAAYPAVFALPYLPSGDVISEAISSAVGDVPIFSSTDGKHITNSEVQISHLTYSSQALFHLSNTASDVSGYKTLTEVWGEVASGTSSAVCTATVNQIIEEFVSPALESPTFFVGAVHLGFYLSADADGDAEAQYELFIRDAGGTETTLCDGTVTLSLTATPTAVLFPYGLGIDNNIIINPTDRMVLKVSVNVTVNSTVTLQIGSATYPAYVIAPTYKQSLGDMRKSVYDPQAIGGDAFNTDNHTDGSVNGVYTLAERAKLAGVESLAQVNVSSALLFLNDTASPIGGSWKTIKSEFDDLSDSTETVTIDNTTGTLLIAEFATAELGKPVIPKGTYSVEAWFSDTEIQVIELVFEFLIRTSGGSETVISTKSVYASLSGAEIVIASFDIIDGQYTNLTDRLCFRIYALTDEATPNDVTLWFGSVAHPSYIRAPLFAATI